MDYVIILGAGMAIALAAGALMGHLLGLFDAGYLFDRDREHWCEICEEWHG